MLIVDDQEMVRAGFKQLLLVEDDITVVGEAATGAEAVERVKIAHPDVILMDVQMPEMDGLEAARLILSGVLNDEADHEVNDVGDDPAEDAPKVVMLTTFGEDEYVFEALRIGASGFLLKNSPATQLIDAIRVAHAGDAMLDPAITQSVIQSFTHQTRPDQPDPAKLGSLTEREREVLLLIANGLSNNEIARELCLGEATVKTHVSNVLNKLDVRDRIQAVIYVYEHGLHDQ